jgi:hypothetical protein
LYCKRSCRQRDYEARRRAAELGLGEHELVVTREELEGLRDRLYMLQCAVDDVERELADSDSDDEDGDEDGDDMRRALQWLLDAARHAVS